MTEDQRWQLWNSIFNDGMDVTFLRGLFEHITDPRFHKLLKIYRMSYDALREYCKPEDA